MIREGFLCSIWFFFLGGCVGGKGTLGKEGVWLTVFKF